MTSFAFEGPAIGGPANGRVLVSYKEKFICLYPANDKNQIYQGEAKKFSTGFNAFHYCAHAYGSHKFFLPAGETLDQFLIYWCAPNDQVDWPNFLQQTIKIIERNRTNAQKENKVLYWQNHKL